MRTALLAAVRFYQRAISPAFPPRCRFYPSCSAYALEAIERHGAGRGSWLALRRLVKCAPWHPGGVDLVPEPAAGRVSRGTVDDGRSSSMPTSPASATRGDAPTTPAPTTPAHPSPPTMPAPHRAPREESSVA